MQTSAVSTRYFGNKYYINEASKNTLLRQTITLAGELATAAQKESTNEYWGRLKDQIGKFGNKISIDDSFHMEEFRFQILSVAVLPYMRTMQTRMTLEPRRFQQITKLLLLLLDESYSHHGHPATLLLLLDEEARRINNEAGWWQSELGVSLRNATELQWMPILQDHRRGLQAVGGQLLFLGVVELIRPVVLLYPVWLLLSEAALVTNQIQASEKVHAESILGMIKAVLTLCVALLQLRVVSLLPGIGYSCLGLGVACYFVAQSDVMLKPLTPMLADNLHKLHKGVDMITRAQTTFLQRVDALLEKRGASDSKQAHVSSNSAGAAGTGAAGTGATNSAGADGTGADGTAGVDVGEKPISTSSTWSWSEGGVGEHCQVEELDGDESEGVVAGEQQGLSGGPLHSTGMRRRK